MNSSHAGQNARSALEHLADRTANLEYSEISPFGLKLVQIALIDTLGVAIAGSITEPAQLARQVLMAQGGSGRSLLFGTAIRSNALDAGMANGVAAHALDFDDGNSIMGGHPSTLLVPAILALGEETGASAKDVIVAYAAGYEILIRLSRGLNSFHYEKGWHPTATIGVFGVAAAGAKLLGLDAPKTAIALAIAASMPSGIKANFGTMVKSFHVGHAVRDGLLCAKLAQSGFSANTGALEAKQGFLEVYNGAGNYSVEKIVGDLNEPLEVNRGFNPLKLYPCCASTHSAIEAALQIRREYSVPADNISAIRIEVDERRMPHTDRPRLQEALSGKFSVQYVVSRGLIDGGVSLSHFEGESHQDPAVKDMMSRIQVQAAPPGGKPNSFDATVTIGTRDGQSFAAHVERRSIAIADSDELNSPQLWSKFSDCAGRLFLQNKVAAIIDAFKTFPDLAVLREFTTLFEFEQRQALVAPRYAVQGVD